VTYRTIANCLGAAVATLAGVLYALWLRYTGPNTTLDFAIMIDILLMVVIGGMGTMYGAVLGATIFVVAQNYLQDLMKLRERRGERHSAPPRSAPSGPVATVVRRAVRPLGVLLPARHRRAAPGVARMSFRSRYVVCEGREIHYTEWGASNAETVIAWHGLARTGRDMDEIAAHLASRFRVICPDTIGRGLSQWSPRPESEYCLEFYGRLAVSLADQLGLATFHWLGTSMGGAIGIPSRRRAP
jgi:hypothetical protein